LKTSNPFDLVLCIETFHCFGSPVKVLRNVKQIIDESQGTFVIADIFEKKDIEKTEALLKEFFIIEKKDTLTINVRHAMNLDKPRIEKLVHQITDIQLLRKIMRNFLASAEASRTYSDLGKTKDYLCYVLRPLMNQASGMET
jgi:ubiquinone/menaquinone biosynthesis C-methylase UbiE